MAKTILKKRKPQKKNKTGGLTLHDSKHIAKLL